MTDTRKSVNFIKCLSQFKCLDAYRVPIHVACNVRLDFPKGEDQINCNSDVSCPLLYTYDHSRVLSYDVWNGHAKCLHSEDGKAMFHYVLCPTSCQCPGNAVFAVNQGYGQLT